MPKLNIDEVDLSRTSLGQTNVLLMDFWIISKERLVFHYLETIWHILHIDINKVEGTIHIVQTHVRILGTQGNRIWLAFVYHA